MVDSVAPARVRARRALVPVLAPAPPEAALAFALIVIPALNEDRFVGRVVHDVVRGGYECLLIDDGSTDRTAEIGERAGATVLRHLITLGQGAALQTGIDWALANGADVIVTFDADGQHRAEEIPLLLDALARTDADFALGSRFLGSAIDMPRSRRLMLRAAIWFTRLATGMRVTDTHNGFRAMTRRGALAISIRQNSMAHASEILHQISGSGLRWVEVPVTVDYSGDTLAKGQSSTGFVSILVDLLMGRVQP